MTRFVSVLLLSFSFMPSSAADDRLRYTAQCYRACITNVPLSQHVTGRASCREAQDMAWYFNACISSCMDIAEVYTGSRDAGRDLSSWSKLFRLYKRVTNPMLESGLWNSNLGLIPDPFTDEWDTACSLYLGFNSPDDDVTADPNSYVSLNLRQWRHGEVRLNEGGAVRFGVRSTRDFGGNQQALSFVDDIATRRPDGMPSGALRYTGVLYAWISKSRRLDQRLFIERADELRGTVTVEVDENNKGFITVTDFKVTSGPTFSSPIRIPIIKFDRDRGRFQAQAGCPPSSTDPVLYASLGGLYGTGGEVMAGSFSSIHEQCARHTNFPRIVGAFAAWRGT